MSTLSPSAGTRERSRRRVVGIAVLALACLVALALAWRPDPLGATRTARAIFDDTGTLGPLEHEVRVAGTPVGRVVRHTRIGDDTLVEMEIERSVGELRADAEADIRPRATFEGTAFVELRPGAAETLLGERPIPRSRTRNYVSITEALSALRPDTRGDVRAAVRAGARVLAPEGQYGAREALRVAPRLTRDGATAARAAQGSHRAELASAIRGLAATTAGVARAERSIGSLLEGGDRTLAALATDGGRPLDRVLAETPALLPSLRRGSAAVTGLAKRTEPLAADLRPGARELGPTLRAVRPLLVEARPVLGDAPPVLRELRRALDAAGRAAPATRVLVAELRASIELLDRAILPALERRTRLGLPAYLQLLSALQGGDGALRPFQTGNPQGNGHFLRLSGRYLGAGAPTPCSALSAVEPEVVRAIAAAGLCAP